MVELIGKLSVSVAVSVALHFKGIDHGENMRVQTVQMSENSRPAILSSFRDTGRIAAALFLIGASVLLTHCGESLDETSELIDELPSEGFETESIEQAAISKDRIWGRAYTRDRLDDASLWNKLLSPMTGYWDGDSKSDRAHFQDQKTFVLSLGNGKKELFKAPGGGDHIFTSFEKVRLGSKGRVSFLLSVLERDDWYNRAPQVLILNKGGGVFERKVLNHINLIGRGVTCTEFFTSGGTRKSICIFASYGRDNKSYSTLVEVTGAGGVRDVTRDKNLPWGVKGKYLKGKYTNGKFMMGFSFVDLNADGLPDLVGAGQHSQIGYSIMKSSGGSYAYSNIKWFDQYNEYMGVTSLGSNFNRSPCVYVRVESRESSRSPKGDYITCYDAVHDSWRKQRMPYATKDRAGDKTINKYVMDARRMNVVEEGPYIYFNTRAVLGNRKIENLVFKIKNKSSTPPLINDLLRSEVFNSHWYLSNNHDVKSVYGYGKERAKHHWMKYGARAGRRAHSSFHSKKYLTNYKDLRDAFRTDYVSAIKHYIRHGIKEARKGI